MLSTVTNGHLRETSGYEFQHWKRGDMRQTTSVILRLMVPLTFAQAASFDCSKAGAKIEKMICGNADLSKLDENLSNAYQQAINQKISNNDVIREQRRWLKNIRNICEDVDCLTLAYTSRANELAALASSKSNQQVPVGGHAAQMSGNPIVGDWDAGSRMFEGLKLSVTDKAVTIGSCERVPYVLIKDHEGHGLNTTPSDSKEKWREVVIELMPINSNQVRCIADSFRVLDFSIPEDNDCHADIAMFRSRKDFESSAGWAWGVWGNNSCSSTQ